VEVFNVSGGYSGDVKGMFQRDVNSRSGMRIKPEQSFAGIAIMPEAFPINQGSGNN
jgi:hypothetical protein